MDVFNLYATISIKMDDFEKGLNEAKKKAETFAKNISSLSSNIDKAYSGIGDLFSPAVDGFKAVESVGKKAGNAITTGLKGFAAASTAVAGFGTTAVKSGMAFDATMSEVSAISGATGDEFDSLRDKALEMGAKTKFSASEAGEAMTYMAMAGWKTGDMLGGIEGIMNLAAASGEDLATTSDIVTDALTAFGMSASDSGHFADIMAATASNANTNVSMMGETFKYVAPVAGALGYSVDDTALAIGLMANSGIKATQAGTSLRSIFTRLSTDAGASKTQLGALGVLTEKLGVQFYNTDGSARELNDVLMDSRAAWSGLTEEQQISYAKTIAGQEAMSGWLALMNASADDVDKLTMSLNECNGAAAEMAATMVDNLQGDLTLLGSAFESLQIAISDGLTPTLREFAQFGQKAMVELLEGFQGGGVSGFMSALSNLVTEGVTMLAAKAPEFVHVAKTFIWYTAEGLLNAKDDILKAGKQIMLDLVGGLQSFPMHYGDQMRELGSGIIELIVTGFSMAGEAISWHIGEFVPLIAEAFMSYHEALFTVGLDILGAIGQGIIENKSELQSMASETISNMVTSLRDNAPMIIEGGIALLEALVGAIMENMPLILETGAEIIGQLVLGVSTSMPTLIAAVGLILPQIAKVIDVVGSIGGAVGSMVNIVNPLINGVVKVVSGGITSIISIGRTLMTGIQALFGLIMAHPVVAVVAAVIAAVTLLWTHCEGFRNFWIGLWENIKTAAGVAIDAIVGIFGGLVDFISNNWQGLLLLIVNPFVGAFKLLYDNCEAFREFIDGILETIGGAFESAGEAIMSALSAAWEAVQSAWSGAVEFFGSLWSSIQTAAGEAASAVSGALSDAWNTITAAWSAATGFFSSLWSGITSTFAGAASWFGGIFSSAWAAVTSAWSGVTDFFSGVWNNITNVFSSVGEKFKSIGKSIVDGLKNGVLGAWDSFIGFITDKVGGIITAVKNLLGIHSPSTVFAGIGENMALGLGEGWNDEYTGIKRKITSGLDFGTATVGLAANGAYSAPGMGWNGPQTGFGSGGDTYVTINSPVAVDAVTAAREWKKTTQRLAMGYV